MYSFGEVGAKAEINYGEEMACASCSKRSIESISLIVYTFFMIFELLRVYLDP